MPQLTEHFSLEELTHSETATKHGIDNTPGEAELARLVTLAEKVLEPLRLAKGRIKVDCAYRCPQVNALVGGVANSQHAKGEAADIKPLDCSLKDAIDWIIDNVEYDQVILEANNWIHVSYSERHPNRRMQLVGEFKNGVAVYGPYIR